MILVEVSNKWFGVPSIFESKHIHQNRSSSAFRAFQQTRATFNTSKHIHQHIKSHKLSNQNMIRQNNIKSNKTKQISERTKSKESHEERLTLLWKSIPLMPTGRKKEMPLIRNWVVPSYPSKSTGNASFTKIVVSLLASSLWCLLLSALPDRTHTWALAILRETSEGTSYKTVWLVF